MHKTKIALLVSSLVFLLSGCAFQQVDKNEKAIEGDYSHSAGLIKDMQDRDASNVFVHDGPWVNDTPVKFNKSRIPASKNCEITYATGTAVTLNEFSKTVNKLCGVPVRITLDAEQKVSGILGQKQNDSANARHEQLVDIRWQGKLDGLLDTVASSMGLSWKYSAGEVNLYYLESKTFNVFAIPSQTDMRSVVQSGIDAGIGSSEEGSSGGSDSNSDNGQSSQTTSVNLTSDMVKDIQSSVSSMLTQGVGRLSVSPSTGTLTVTDTPEVLERIQRYIDGENKSITRQVLLNVKVLSVTLDDSSQFGIDWNLVYSGGKFGSTMTGNMSTSASDFGANSISASILNGNYADSSLLLNALSQQGKVSVVTSPSVTTLNMQPVPVQVATQTSYLARVESSNTANVGTSMTLTPGTVTSGFNMNLLPFVMPDDRLLLQYSINLSELKSLKEVKSSDSDDGNKIQVPEVENRIFSQKVKLRSGQTLVLSGFEQNSTKANRSGFGSAFNWLLGGGLSASDKRNIIVIIISPVVME